eukprot:CAMPEP_0197546252 /NCGR_PEP_ID=MMETSP1320-20131121/934_1 /TAXON_ID=91990 /ORGANISM="Bolidomonas sp., Strain RCC2347" /LENGTH=64 /DNA_ID=CAMNT_0043105801 /DNA_START=131 /DNA_END=322 /DNA_ORIENTATION=-
MLARRSCRVKFRHKRALDLEAEDEAVGPLSKGFVSQSQPSQPGGGALTQIQTPASGRAHTYTLM